MGPRREKGVDHIERNRRLGSEVGTPPHTDGWKQHHLRSAAIPMEELVVVVRRRDTLCVPVFDGSHCLVALITWETWRRRTKEMDAVSILQHLLGAQEGEKCVDRYPQNKIGDKKKTSSDLRCYQSGAFSTLLDAHRSLFVTCSVVGDAERRTRWVLLGAKCRAG